MSSLNERLVLERLLGPCARAGFLQLLQVADQWAGDHNHSPVRAAAAVAARKPRLRTPPCGYHIKMIAVLAAARRAGAS